MKGKVVFITGAAGGIGAATAVKFAQLGCQLILTDKDDLQQILNSCKDIGLADKDICCVHGNLRKEDDINQILMTGLAKFNSVDVVVNVAGTTYPGNLNTNLDILDKEYLVHFRAVYLICQKLCPYLIKTKGCIVNISSVNAQVPNIAITPYCTMKAAQAHFTRCLALEMAPHGVRVNGVNPGVIETPLHFLFQGKSRNYDMEDKDSVDKYFEKVKSWSPMGVNGKPEDIASAVVYLASDDSKFITGAGLLIDGGWLLRTGICDH